MSTLSPSLFVGLGGRGAEISRATSEYILRASPELSQLHRGLFVDGSGVVHTLDQGERELFTIGNIQAEASAGTWAKNLEAFLEHEKEFLDAITTSAREVRQATILTELQRQGAEVLPGVNLYLFSSVFDTVGSAIAVPMLALCRRAIADNLNLMMHTDLILFGRDLFEESKSSTNCSIRSYTFFSELDWLKNNPDLLFAGASLQTDHIWVLSRGNESGEFASSHKELVPMIAEYLLLQLTNAIPRDHLYDGALINEDHGKACHYGSFGLRKLSFPVDQVMDAIKGFIAFNVLESRGLLQEGSVDRGRANALARGFIEGVGVERLPEQLPETEDGSAIWEDFRFDGKMNEGTDVEDFLRNLQDQVRAFENKRLPAFYQSVSARKDSLLKNFSALLKDTVHGLIDNNDGHLRQVMGGGLTKDLVLDESGLWLSRTDGFLAALAGEESEVFKGHSPEELLSIHDLKSDVHQYFYDELGVSEEVCRLKDSLVELAELDSGIADDEPLSSVQDCDDSVLSQSDSDVSEPADDEADEGIADEEAEGAEASGVTRSRREVLQEEIDRLEEKIRKADQTISDINECRRIIVGRRHAESDREFQEQSQAVIKTEHDLRDTAKDLSEMEESRQVFARNHFVLFPIGIVVIVALLWAVSVFLLDQSFLGSLKVFAAVLAVGLITFFAWAFRKYRDKITTPLHNLEQKLSNLKASKSGLLVKLQNNRNDYLRVKFSFYLHCKLVELLEEAVVLPNQLLNDIREFSREVSSFVDEAKAIWEHVKFPYNVYVRSVVEKDDIGRYIETVSSLQIEMQEFFREKPLSSYFEDFQERHSVESLRSRIDKYTERSFDFVRNKTVDDVIRDVESVDPDRMSLGVKNFFESVSAFTSLAVEKGLDRSMSVVLVGLPDPENSPFRDQLKYHDLEQQAHFLPFRSCTEIITLKLKLGFPAFYMNLVQSAKADFDSSEHGDAYFCKSEWGVGDLIPLFGMDEKPDAVRTTACLSLVLELICPTDKGWTRDGQKIADSHEQLLTFLRSMKGSSVRRELERLIEAAKQVPDELREKIQKYLDMEPYPLDGLDRSILESTLDELNPLA